MACRGQGFKSPLFHRNLVLIEIDLGDSLKEANKNINSKLFSYEDEIYLYL